MSDLIQLPASADVDQFSDWLNDLASQAVAPLPETHVERFKQHVRGALAQDPLTMRYHPAGTQQIESKSLRYRRRRRKEPRAVSVPRLKEREIEVKIAANEEEWRNAFELVAHNYKAAGYEGSMSCKVRFTPYHALPDSVTFIAKHGERVLMTMTLVPDNRLLGLPLEVLYEEEVQALRRQRRRLGEVISLAADQDLGMREFRQVFVSMIRLMKQYHVTQGGDTWVITVNPRHTTYYTKALGYQQLGPQREYPAVEGHPAIAYMLDVPLMEAKAPKMHREIFDEWLPGEALRAPRIPIYLVHYLSQDASEEARENMPASVFDFDKYFTSPRCW